MLGILTGTARIAALAVGLPLTVIATAAVLVATLYRYRRALRQERAAEQEQTLSPAPQSEPETATGAETVRKTASAEEAADMAIERSAEEAADTAIEAPAEEATEEVVGPVTEKETPPQETVPAENAERRKEETAATADVYPDFIVRYLATAGEENGKAFERIVLKNDASLTTRVALPVSQYDSEQAFLTDFFRSCSKFAKLLPIAVTEMLYKRYVRRLDGDKDKSRAMRKMIAAYYARRKQEDTLGKCEKLCKADVTYWLDTVGLTGKALPPLKKLVTLCVAQKRFDEALAWCDVAVAHGIIDTKGEGYEGRRTKIEEKQAKYKEKAAKVARKGKR